MSTVGARKATDPLGSAITKTFGDPLNVYGNKGAGIDAKVGLAPITQPVQAAAPVMPERAKTMQFESRKEDMRSASGAAGVTSLESDYDMLGRPRGNKRKGAARALLGE